jgi:hypothetical protein
MKKKAYKDFEKAKQEIIKKFPSLSPADIQKVEVVYAHLPQYIRGLAEKNQSKAPELGDVIMFVRPTYNLNFYVLQDLVANYYKENNLKPGTPMKTSSRKIGMPRISSRQTK